MKTNKFGNRESLASDLVAGITNALVYIPKGMAYGLVAGINPVYGLYTGMVSPFVGALFAGSSFMAIVATNELAVSTGGILAGLGGGAAIQVLFTLTLLAGVFQLAFGLLRLGSMVRFISESVMTGFVTGVAVLLILGQLEKLTGYHGEFSGNALLKTWNWILHLDQIDGATTFVGLTSIAVILLLQKTRLHKFALVLAMVFAGLLAAITNQESVSLLGDAADISGGLPSPVLPDLKTLPELVVPALSLAILGLSVSAGVSQSYPEPDGSIPDSSRDFVGQGAANIAAGFFQGMPAGGSFSNMAISVGAGAKTRMANVFFAIILVFSLLTISGLLKRIPLAALAALLIVVGFEMINPQRILRVRSTHWSERLAMGLTFLLTLTIPLQYAILAGVLFTLGLYIYSSSQKLLIVENTPLGDGRYEERPAPPEFPSNQTTILGLAAERRTIVTLGSQSFRTNQPD